MENKQTAVEWYSDKLLDILGELVNNFTIEQTLANHYALKKAKEMEKGQHDKTSLDWYLEGQSRRSNNKKWNSFEHYWEQTYGGKDE